MNSQNTHALVPQKEIAMVRDTLTKLAPHLQMVATKVLTPEKITKIVTSAISRNPMLLQCFRDSQHSILRCVFAATQLGLDPDSPLGQCYMIPFRNGKTGKYEAQFLIGYRGLIDLARRSGNIISIRSRVVYEKDQFAITYGLKENLLHIPFEGEGAGAIRAVYAVAELKDGGIQYEVMYKHEIDAIRRRSRAGNSGPWVSDYAEMARKGLALDTPIPTPSGWSAMADLEVGSVVFDMNGIQTEVIAVSDVKNLPCFRVTFSNGDQVVCDDEHRWVARIGTSNAHRSPYRVHTVNELYDAIQDGMSVTIPVQSPIDIDDIDLPIDPYLLGYWLGNGTARAAKVTCCIRDYSHVCDMISEAGFKLGSTYDDERSSAVDIGICDGFLVKLRDCNLLQNKHVPAEYLRSSIRQRRALVQGLMDSDGCIESSRGRAKFSSTNHLLANAMYELVHSLGDTCTLRSRRVKGYGVETVAHEIEWKPSFQCVRIPRKSEKIQDRKIAPYRSIQFIEKVASVPTRCIAVASETETYLCGKSMAVTHNTVIRRLAKYLPLTVDLARGIEHEQAHNEGGVSALDLEMGAIPQLTDEGEVVTPEEPATPSDAHGDELTARLM